MESICVAADVPVRVLVRDRVRIAFPDAIQRLAIDDGIQILEQDGEQVVVAVVVSNESCSE